VRARRRCARAHSHGRALPALTRAPARFPPSARRPPSVRRLHHSSAQWSRAHGGATRLLTGSRDGQARIWRRIGRRQRKAAQPRVGAGIAAAAAAASLVVEATGLSPADELRATIAAANGGGSVGGAAAPVSPRAAAAAALAWRIVCDGLDGAAFAPAAAAFDESWAFLALGEQARTGRGSQPPPINMAVWVRRGVCGLRLVAPCDWLRAS
jgi:hypothetical protein